MIHARRRLFLALAAALCLPAHAEDAPPPKAQDLEAVSVIGQGETRQVQRIVPEDQKVLPPGTSPQKILNRLPGVSVQSNDAFGANENRSRSRCAASIPRASATRWTACPWATTPMAITTASTSRAP